MPTGRKGRETSIRLRYLGRLLVTRRFARSWVVASDQSSRERERERVRGNGPGTVQATRASNTDKRTVKLIRRVVLWYVLPSKAGREKREYIEVSCTYESFEREWIERESRG